MTRARWVETDAFQLGLEEEDDEGLRPSLRGPVRRPLAQGGSRAPGVGDLLPVDLPVAPEARKFR